GLNWAHYRVLMQLQDKDERGFYEELASTGGLSVRRLQSAIRLARIDSPPRDTPTGKAGRRFVRKQLAVARTVVVNTRKYDIHRRYVAHVFYAFNNQGIDKTFFKGRYLNQELIDKGFAKGV
ncbi:MAG: thermonuclease family protein, partial [Polyangiales bacterium]